MKTTAVDQVLCHIISSLCSSPTDQGLANFFLKRERPYFRFHRPYSFCGSRRWWTCYVPIKLYLKKRKLVGLAAGHPLWLHLTGKESWRKPSSYPETCSHTHWPTFKRRSAWLSTSSHTEYLNYSVFFWFCVVYFPIPVALGTLSLVSTLISCSHFMNILKKVRE